MCKVTYCLTVDSHTAMIQPPTKETDMPSCDSHYYGFWQADPRRWEQCRNEAAKQMIADRWDSNARKFETVCRKKALKLWAQ